jgi:hypothetical protein
MNRARVTRAYEKIAEGYAELALAFADEQPAAGAGVPSPAQVPAPVDFPDDLPPPTGWDEPGAAETAEKAPLGVCPTHRTAWTVKAGGISKNGKPYSAFWKCSAKDGDVFCKQKPTPGWAKAHPIPLDVAA